MKAIRQALFFTAVLLLSLPASAGWLALCDHAGQGTLLQRYISPDGIETSLLIAAAPVAGCRQLEISVSAAAIRWADVLAPDVAARLDAGVSLLGEDSGNAMQVSEVIPARAAATSAAARPLALTLGSNTLPNWDLQVFGKPVRATARRVKEGIELRCEAGGNDAGLLLTAQQYVLPVGARLRLLMRYRATADFAVTFADAGQLVREAPSELGQLPTHAIATDHSFALPAVVAPVKHALSLLCPDSDAQLQLVAMQLLAGEPATSTGRATWVWRGDHALNHVDALIAALQADDIHTLFLAIPLTGDPPAVADPDRLATLIEAARARGIDTWAVEGDPAAVTARGRAHFVQRTRALAEFNASQRENRRLAGVQYDIEPYLLPGFDLAPETWLQAYVDTLAEVRGELAAPMEAAVPFWWSGLTVAGQPLLTAMAPLVDGLTVMNYRTNPEQLQRLAEPYLAWGVQQRRPVRIALESAALPDQTLTHFQRGNRGRLWQLTLGDAQVLLLLADPATNPAGPTFSRAYTTRVPAAGTTFRDQRELLDESLPALVEYWSAWPSFAGAALHGYLASFD